MQSLLARISLSAVRHNAKLFGRVSSRPLIAVVKDDAYGHGAAEVSLSLRGVASCFAVATVREGAALRTAGISEDILVLTPPLCEEEALRLVLYDLIGCLSSMPALRLLAKAGESAGRAPRAHLAVNTGMNRYGFPPARVGAALKDAESGGILVEGVFSHYFEPSQKALRTEQDRLFRTAEARVKERFPAARSHLSATGGVLFGGELCDAVRVGLGLYGYLPEECGLPVKRAMKLYAAVSHRCRQFGGGLGYARAEEDFGALHTLRLGYGDGFFREGLEGAIGRLCMDAAVCKGDAPFGERRLVVDDFARYAERHGTSVYEALVRLAGGAEREYTD